MDLKNNVVLITGASAGIGEAAAREFARRGSKLILTARSQEGLERVARSLAPAPAAVLPADLSVPKEAASVIERAMACYGVIDVLVNNAGVGLYLPFWLADRADVRRMMEVNFFAPLELIRGVLRHFRRQGGGTIVNVSSVAGKIPLPWLTLYSGSKAALNFISDGLRMELRGSGIRIVSVCPGYVSTGFSQHVLGGKIPRAVANRRSFTITPEQCAGALVKGVERGQRTVVTPRIGWVFIAFERLLPWAVHAILARMQSPPELGEARS